MVLRTIGGKKEFFNRRLFVLKSRRCAALSGCWNTDKKSKKWSGRFFRYRLRSGYIRFKSRVFGLPFEFNRGGGFG